MTVAPTIKKYTSLLPSFPEAPAEASDLEGDRRWWHCTTAGKERTKTETEGKRKKALRINKETIKIKAEENFWLLCAKKKKKVGRLLAPELEKNESFLNICYLNSNHIHTHPFSEAGQGARMEVVSKNFQVLFFSLLKLTIMGGNR